MIKILLRDFSSASRCERHFICVEIRRLDNLVVTGL